MTINSLGIEAIYYMNFNTNVEELFVEISEVRKKSKLLRFS